MRKTLAAVIVISVTVLTLFFLYPQKPPLAETMKACFNQLQWRELDFSQADVVYVNFYVNQDKVDRVSMKEITCSLSKLGFPNHAINKVKVEGEGVATSADPRFSINWYTRNGCRVLNGCDDTKESKYKDRLVSISIFEIKSP
jgi:hypothetical protein